MNMNRQIKFRVWDKITNRYLQELGIYYWHIPYSLDGEEITGEANLFGLSELLRHNNFVAQQYTGLTDKNGEEIYEGDIVKINRCYTRPFVNEKQQIDYRFIDDGEVEVGQVLWGWNSQKYLVSYEHIRYDDIEDFDKPSHKVEVIGNIFENPELLK